MTDTIDPDQEPVTQRKRGRRQRIPKTVANSKYSIYERYRARSALVSYRQRRGLSYEALLDQMHEVLSPSQSLLFMNLVTLKGFLRGVESDDLRVEAAVDFVRARDNRLLIGFRDDQFIQLAGDVFTDLFDPLGEDVDYNRALRTHKGKSLAGIYVKEPSPLVGEIKARSPWMLSVRYIENSPFLLLHGFVINWGESDYGEQHSDYWTIRETTNPSRTELRELLSELIESKMVETGANERFDRDAVLHDPLKGLCLSGERNLFFLRDRMRREPSFGIIKPNPDGIFIVRSTFDDFYQEDFARDSFFTDNMSGMLYKLHSPSVEKMAAYLPWSL